MRTRLAEGMGDAAPATVKQGALYSSAAVARDGGAACEPLFADLLPTVLDRQADKVGPMACPALDVL